METHGRTSARTLAASPVPSSPDSPRDLLQPPDPVVCRDRDEGVLDTAYKLAEYGAAGDTIGRAAEELAGRPLMEPVMKNGQRLPAGHVSLEPHGSGRRRLSGGCRTGCDKTSEQIRRTPSRSALH